MKYSALLFSLAATIMLASCNSGPHPAKTTATFIYRNARIWTGDSSLPEATTIAVLDSIILYVGNNADSLAGEDTEFIDAGGQLIVPGFIDNHTHFLNGGYQLASVNLRNAKSRDEFIHTLKTYAAKLTDDRWIMGGDWDHEAMGGGLPTKEWIDSVTGTRPLFVSRYDGHMALANSETLKRAGIDKNTQNPAGGEIVRHPQTGEPTGVLKDAAMDLVYAKMPAFSLAQLNEMLQRATAHAHANGVTQVHDVGSDGGWTDLNTFTRARKDNTLAVRIYSMVPVSNWKRMADYVKENGRGDDLLRWGALKGFVDGSLGSTTAWFFQPYLDQPGSRGLIISDTVDLRRQILAADSAGLQVAVHAIGDRANDWLLDVFEEAHTRRGNTESRFRIEHAQHLSAAAIGRFAALNVIPSMQPYHAIDDGRWAARRLDNDRLKRTYAFKSLLDAGARLTFGSDWTVGPLTPLEGIYAAVTRQTLDGANPNGWYPEQKISVEQALRSYTVNNAYAGFHENKTGMLKVGMLADFVVLSEDLFKIAPEKIRDVKVTRTILNGKTVFEIGQSGH